MKINNKAPSCFENKNPKPELKYYEIKMKH